MANNIENLKSLSTEKAREIGSKGGKASVKAKRKKKYIKEQLETLMLLDLNDCKLKDNMRKLGIPEDELSIQNAMCVSLVQQALNRFNKKFSSNKGYFTDKTLKLEMTRKEWKIYIFLMIYQRN